MKLFIVEGKMNYFYLKYNAKLQLASVNKLIANYEKEGLLRLLRIGLKISFVKLTSDYKVILTKVRDAVTDGWFVSKDTGIKVLGTAIVGLFYNQGLHFELYDFAKPLYKFFTALDPLKMKEFLAWFTEKEIQAFWTGMIAMSNKTRSESALEILKFSEIVNLSSL